MTGSRRKTRRGSGEVIVSNRGVVGEVWGGILGKGGEVGKLRRGEVGVKGK